MPSLDDARSDRIMDPAALDRLWDAMQRQIEPVGGRHGAPSLAAAETIRRLEASDDVPHVTPDRLEAIWAEIAKQVPATTPVRPVSSATGVSLIAQVMALVQTVIRQAAIGAIAGFLVGALVIGVGARLIMRLAAMLADPAMGIALTENGNRVGEITLDGTLAILIFTGAMFGWLGGIVVMAVRPWLPASGWRRGTAAGAIGFAVAGSSALEAGENGDYKRFGILGVNICLFTLLPFLFGVAVVPVIDALDRRVPRSLPSLRRGLAAGGLSALMVLLSVPLITFVFAAIALEPPGLLLLLPIVRVLTPIWARHAASMGARRERENRARWLGYATLAVSCSLGLILTAQAVSRLLE